MAETGIIKFDAEVGSVIRACDFGPEFDARHATLPDLDPLEPTAEEGVYLIRSQDVRAVRRGIDGRSSVMFRE